jgi:hypothetical protein
MATGDADCTRYIGVSAMATGRARGVTASSSHSSFASVRRLESFDLSE